ncbi:MAG: O-antigen ligase family protein [Bryobacteraceae bacterium]
MLSYNHLIGGRIGAGWLACPLLVPYWLMAFSHRSDWARPRHIWPGVCLVAAFIPAAILSTEPVRILGESGKFALAFLFVYPILLSRRSYASTAMQACVAAAMVNAALVVLGLAGVPGVLFDAGTGRYTTALLGSGELGRLGAGVLGYSLLLLASSAIPIRGLALVFSAALLLLYDGSRAAIVVSIVVILLAAWLIWIELRRGSAHRLRVAVGLAVAAVAFALAVPRLVQSGVLSLNDRVVALTDVSDGGISDSLQNQDSLRYDQYGFAAARIADNPFFGAGFTEYDLDGGFQTLHNSYLQAWVDLGLLGVTSFIALTLWWIPRTKRILNQMALLPTGERPLCYGAFCCLVVCALINLFAPIPSELTDCTMFLAASALCAHFDRDAVMKTRPNVRSVRGQGAD